MANSWTSDQKKAIETDGHNILVSAAAGSGKTAVLVERIIRKITSPDSDTDIDRLVVVTFTKAAAAEMKQRIRRSVDTLIEMEPSNEKLQRQLSLVDNAQITTIDSFCLNIIRNYFADIDIDPGFKIADEGEIKLIENDVMQDMLEEYYAMNDKDFFDFVDAYTTGRDDSAIEDIILKLYGYAKSYPWPNEWFESSLSVYDINSLDELEEKDVVIYLKDYIRYRMEDFDKKYEQAESVCLSPMGPEKYLAAISQDHASMKMILEAETIEKIGQLVNMITFSNIGRVSAKDTDEDKKEFVKGIRDDYKNFIKKELQDKIFARDLKLVADDLKKAGRFVKVMVKLAKDFGKRMQKEKRSRNIIDFNDMEHLALDVLVKRKDRKIEYTEVSDALSEYYSEIFIDEYQDSNMLQEVILNAISKGKYDESKNNIYMVGDVKQSIYKFRMACPYLFMDKYNRYSTDLSKPFVKILLQANFRSKKNVLESVNDVFKKAMTEEFCGISYDESAQLNAGLEYPTDMQQVNSDTHIYVIEQKDAARQDEGKAIADIIKNLVRQKPDGTYNMVFDKNCPNGYRKIRYSDIVILTRSVKGWSDTFVNVLMNENIPAYCDSSQGYFNVREIKLILNYLAVIDNPLQDIPMAAVMLSYFGRFDTNELAVIRNIDKDSHIFEVMKKITDGVSGEDTNTKQDLQGEFNLEEALKKKIIRFVEQTDRLRQMKETLSISDLLWDILYNTGYYDYVGTMPAGQKRQANLDILLSKAASFEKTSYSGLFNFLRYIERLKKFDIDFGEASVLGENDDLVRVMSIHKSKGLEFPVVIIAGMGKKINQQDASGAVIIDNDLGIGTNLIDVGRRTKRGTLIKEAVSKKISQENISEELRVLYVAMTRAKEKLIMTGTVSDIETAKDKWNKVSDRLKQASSYSYADILGFGNYFDIVMPVVNLPKEQLQGNFSVDYIKEDDSNQKISGDEQVTDNSQNYNLEEYESGDTVYNNDEKLVQLPDYPYETGKEHRVKVTVSELKKMQYDADFEENDMAIDAVNSKEDDEQEYIPQFILGKQEKPMASERGTAYHRVMECLDFSMTDSIEQIEECINKMLVDEKINSVQAECVNAKDIFEFTQSPIGQRIKKADLAQKVKREQPFVFGINQPDSDETLLVQGIIDLYFEEDGKYIIVDYKTDRVSKNKNGENTLIKRYAVQLDYYAKALKQITGKDVEQKVIYSFTLGKEIEMGDGS